MRILMLDNEFPPKGGGMGTANKALFKQFAANADLEIDLITSSLENEFSTIQFSNNIRIIYVPVGTGNIHHASNFELIRYSIQTFIQAKNLLSNQTYDFCFAWSALPAGGVAYFLEKVYSLPYMTWISGPDTPGFERRYDYLFPFIKPFLKVIWHRSQPLIAKCREEVHLIKTVVPDQFVEIIPNGVDLENFWPGEMHNKENPLVVICTARLIERKGQRQLIEATHKLKMQGVDIQLKLVGEGDARIDYQKLAERLDVLDRVDFMGFVAPVEIPDLLRAADVFAMPSYFEGVSLSTLEAMGCGLPILVTKTGGISDMVFEGINGFTFEWQDVDRLANYLAELSRDRDLVERMGRASVEIAQRFDWREVSKLFLELFEKFEYRRT